MNAYERLAGLNEVEILGAPEILGDPAAMVQTEADVDMVRYTEAGYKASDKIFFGIGGGVALAAASVATYQAQVNTPFKPLRITMASAQVPDLFIESAKIGPIDLIDGDPIPAEVFSEVSLNNRVSWPTAETSQNIVFRIRNQSALDARNIAIAIWGVRLRK